MEFFSGEIPCDRFPITNALKNEQAQTKRDVYRKIQIYKFDENFVHFPSWTTLWMKMDQVELCGNFEEFY